MAGVITINDSDDDESTIQDHESIRKEFGSNMADLRKHYKKLDHELIRGKGTYVDPDPIINAMDQDYVTNINLSFSSKILKISVYYKIHEAGKSDKDVNTHNETVHLLDLTDKEDITNIKKMLYTKISSTDVRLKLYHGHQGTLLFSPGHCKELDLVMCIFDSYINYVDKNNSGTPSTNKRIRTQSRVSSNYNEKS